MMERLRGSYSQNICLCQSALSDSLSDSVKEVFTFIFKFLRLEVMSSGPHVDHF